MSIKQIEGGTDMFENIDFISAEEALDAVCKIEEAANKAILEELNRLIRAAIEKDYYSVLVIQNKELPLEVILFLRNEKKFFVNDKTEEYNCLEPNQFAYEISWMKYNHPSVNKNLK